MRVPVAALLALLGCRNGGPALTTSPRAPDVLAVRLEPTEAVIYKIDDDLDHENWDFAIAVRGDAAAVDRVRIEHRRGDRALHTIEYAAAALEPYRDDGDAGEIVWRYLNFRLPAALAIDSVQVTLLGRGRPLGMARAPLVRFAQRQSFRLPVQGCWFVSSGHDFGVEHRRHYSRGHFAWDLVRVDSRGRVASDPGRLEDFYGYRQPVVAPADGVVAAVRDGFADNPPGVEADIEHANFVVIEHLDDVRSRVAHLSPGSLRVKVGDRVTAGQVVGLVGNSGSSATPHLHFQFERAGTEGARESPLPVQLGGYRVSWNQGTDEPVARGRPRRGQFVCAE